MGDLMKSRVIGVDAARLQKSHSTSTKPTTSGGIKRVIRIGDNLYSHCEGRTADPLHARRPVDMECCRMVASVNSSPRINDAQNRGLGQRLFAII
jgi:hypothetical protein